MDEWQAKVHEVVEAISRDERHPVGPLVEGLSREELQAAEAWLDGELNAMPTPAGARWNNPLGRKHHALERLRDAVRGQLGDAGAREQTALCDWMLGDASAAPFVRLQLERGERTGARLSASAALKQENCPDRAELQRLLDEAVGVPDGLAGALDAFAAAPSEEGWEALFRFTPEESDYEWLQYIIQGLVSRGIDANRLFELASREVTPGLLELLDSGKVDPEVVVRRAWRSPAAQNLWLVFAARAAIARGDEETTLRLLKDVAQREKLEGILLLQLIDIRERASAEFNARLDREGLATVEEVLEGR